MQLKVELEKNFQKLILLCAKSLFLIFRTTYQLRQWWPFDRRWGMWARTCQQVSHVVMPSQANVRQSAKTFTGWEPSPIPDDSTPGAESKISLYIQ